MITSMELLSATECDRIESQIKELRRYWIPRGAKLESSHFFTLGAASYLDDPALYPGRAAELNPVLRDGFGWLHTRVAEFLGRRLRAPVSFADGLALPGFHIWLAPAIFTTPSASVHFDLQYLRAWPEAARGADTSRPLSFTVPIRLPRRGGWLNLWDITYERYRQFCDRLPCRIQAADVTTLIDRIRHPYTRGAIATHSGHLLHQIGEIDEVAPDDERITLQGHGLFQHGEWKLYW